MRERLDVDVLCQGDDSTAELVRRFAGDRSTCLFGTLSLWQGVDVPGSACHLVVIDRIPFPRPDDPLVRARQEAAGPAGFMAVSAASAALLLAQGSGRLIRSVDRPWRRRGARLAAVHRALRRLPAAFAPAVLAHRGRRAGPALAARADRGRRRGGGPVTSPDADSRLRRAGGRGCATSSTRSGCSAVAPFEREHVRPWATAVRVPTDDGVVWFKAHTPLLAHEAPVTRVLARLRPDVVLEVLASDDDRCWLRHQGRRRQAADPHRGRPPTYGCWSPSWRRTRTCSARPPSTCRSCSPPAHWTAAAGASPSCSTRGARRRDRRDGRPGRPADRPRAGPAARGGARAAGDRHRGGRAGAGQRRALGPARRQRVRPRRGVPGGGLRRLSRVTQPLASLVVLQQLAVVPARAGPGCAGDRARSTGPRLEPWTDRASMADLLALVGRDPAGGDAGPRTDLAGADLVDRRARRCASSATAGPAGHATCSAALEAVDACRSSRRVRGCAGPRSTRPRTVASSPGIGAYAGLCGISQTWPSRRLNVLTVASPSIIAATMSPLSATCCWRTTTQSPSQIAASTIESPTTLSRNSSPSPTSWRGSGNTSSTACSARIGPPAAIRPDHRHVRRGRPRVALAGRVVPPTALGVGRRGTRTSMARGRLGSRRRKPLRSSVASWWATDDGEVRPTASPISRIDGG